MIFVIIFHFHKECKSFEDVILCTSIECLNFYLHKITQYNSLNVKLSNSWLSKLNPAIRNETEVALILLSNMIGDD